MVFDVSKQPPPEDTEVIDKFSSLKESDILYGYGSNFDQITGTFKDTTGMYKVGVFHILNITPPPTQRDPRKLIGYIFFGIQVGKDGKETPQRKILLEGQEIDYNNSRNKLYKKTGEPTESENQLKQSLIVSLQKEQEAAALKAAIVQPAPVQPAQGQNATVQQEATTPTPNVKGGGRSKRRTRRKKRTRKHKTNRRGRK